MTERPADYSVGIEALPLPGEAGRLPRRAWNLAMRMLEIERKCAGRGRVAVQVVMFDGQWLLDTDRPVELEKLGE